MGCDFEGYDSSENSYSESYPSKSEYESSDHGSAVKTNTEIGSDLFKDYPYSLQHLETDYNAPKDCKSPEFDLREWIDFDHIELQNSIQDGPLPDFQFQTPQQSPERQSATATFSTPSEYYPCLFEDEMGAQPQDALFSKSAPVPNSTSATAWESILDLPRQPSEWGNPNEAPFLRIGHSSTVAHTVRNASLQVTKQIYSNLGEISFTESLPTMKQGYTNTDETVNPQLLNTMGQVGDYSPLQTWDTPVPGPTRCSPNPFRIDSTYTNTSGLSPPETGSHQINHHDPQSSYVSEDGSEESFKGFPESPPNSMAPPDCLPHDLSRNHESLVVELKSIIRPTDCDHDVPLFKRNITKGMNKRAAKIEAYNLKWPYTPIPYTPDAWGPNCEYKYHRSGELEAPIFYSAKEILHLLLQNPAHGQKDGQSGLRLWIQRSPPNSTRRYGQVHSFRCRFKECPVTDHSIIRYQLRVAIDELSFAHPNHDPQINAGYVHLYCLEKFLDFPAICYLLDVRVDTRDLPYEPDGKNRMMLASTHEKEIAAKFLAICKRGELPSGHPHFRPPNRPYEDTLSHRLREARLNGEPNMFKLQKVLKGIHGKSVTNHLLVAHGESITGHLRNLQLQRGDRVRGPKRKKPLTKTVPRKKQRKIDEHDSEEDTEGEKDGDAEEEDNVEKTEACCTKSWDADTGFLFPDIRR